MNAIVYLADLRHTYAGVLSSDSMPLNIGFIKAVMDRELPSVSSSLFVYPEDLQSKIASTPPDVLMLSNYSWNEELSLRFARLVKARYPDTLVVFGGPNIHDEPERQKAYVEVHPEIDFYVLGEGDFLATQIVEQFLSCNFSIEELQKRHIPSAVYRGADGVMTRNDIQPRQRELEEIPSPWLTGVMDQFFDGKLSPMWETNRGCPFTCTFCVQGTDYYNKVNYFSIERLSKEIDYMGRNVRDLSPNMGTLRIADPNYGMFERDIELSGLIGEGQKKYGWPTFIDATTGKNRSDRILKSVEKTSGALALYQAVQSLDEDVLSNIRRSNIKLDAYEKIQIYVRGRGLRSTTDLILGLPGETLVSHVKGMLRMIDAGVNRLNNFQCMLLKGTELDRLESREKFQFSTKYRVVPKCFGLYEDEPVFEIEEIIVSTNTLPFEDYLRARRYHLACAVFVNHGRLERLLRLGERHGIQRSELFLSIAIAMETSDGEIGDLVAQFMTDTNGELFDTREAVGSFYQEAANLARLVEGDIGDNLIYRYTAIACLQLWDAACKLATGVVKEELARVCLEARGSSFEAFWDDFSKLERLRYVNGSTVEDLYQLTTISLNHDINRWIEEGFSTDWERYRFKTPQETQLRLSAERQKELEDAVSVWSLANKGTTMMIKRIKPSILERDLCLAL